MMLTVSSPRSAAKAPMARTADCLGPWVEELEAWRRLGVRGHSAGEHPWLPYHELLTGPMARLVGARDEEVVMMNSLTANLHLMLATFFRRSLCSGSSWQRPPGFRSGWDSGRSSACVMELRPFARAAPDG